MKKKLDMADYDRIIEFICQGENHPKPIWEFRDRIASTATPGKNQFVLSEYINNEPAWYQLADVIHEVCHCLVKNKDTDGWHGKRFKALERKWLAAFDVGIVYKFAYEDYYIVKGQAYKHYNRYDYCQKRWKWRKYNPQ